MARRIASAAGAGAGWLVGVCARSDGIKMAASATMAKRERQIGFMVGRVWKIRAVKANDFTAVICCKRRLKSAGYFQTRRWRFSTPFFNYKTGGRFSADIFPGRLYILRRWPSRL
jgi:hypothetical protein